ncbi:proteasomal ATPase-associated factor 1-like [Liolophura sinensis]|uniref:proteasomal ATPase-associated factor 1-like n=1 Tax=Liolophura sinensis TaxID=3198878 RepID=UPI0031580D2F
MAPQVRYSTVHKKKVNSLDVTDGGLAVSSDMEGHLKVWETSSGDIRRLLTGHIGDVYTCRFFPSGVVILSGGADMQLKIWSAETGQCAATLRGHKGGIQDTAIVDRGRNIVSCSRDGTAKLWDCGQSTCLVTFAECGGILNACALGATASGINLGTSPSTISDREVLTGGKMLLLACENKTLQAYGLQSREKIFELDCHSAVNSCTFISPESAVCGTEDGHVTVIDLRNYRVPLKEWKEQRSSILSLLPFKQGFFASSGDGSCFRVTEEFKTDLELTGPDCDPVYKVVNDAQTIYTACRDGLIRKYRLDMT